MGGMDSKELTCRDTTPPSTVPAINEIARLSSPQGDAYSYGRHVSIRGNTMAVGAPNTNGLAISGVKLKMLSTSMNALKRVQWVLNKTIASPLINDTRYLMFGHVALNEDANVLVVGHDGVGRENVYVYERNLGGTNNRGWLNICCSVNVGFFKYFR
ncbi:MAG: hypothetical protein R2865_00540 [Deinococcales bacterium]